MDAISNSTPQSNKRHKTYKRELAIGVLSLWGLITIKLFWYTSPELVAAFNGPYSTLTMAMMGLVGFAIGAEWVSLQSPWKPDKAVPNV